MKPNIPQSFGPSAMMVQSRYTHANRASPHIQSLQSDENADAVQIQDTITLFPWVDTIQQLFIERLQPYWLTSKQQITDSIKRFIYGTHTIQSQSLYIVFWGVLTSSIVLYFSNKTELSGRSLFYYFLVLTFWNLSSACLLFFYSKIASVAYISFLANINMIANSYILMLLPLALISASPSYLKVLFSVFLFVLLTYILVKNYSNVWQLNFPKNIPIYIIFSIANLILIYLIFFFSNQQSTVSLPVPTPQHNLHQLFKFN